MVQASVSRLVAWGAKVPGTRIGCRIESWKGAGAKGLRGLGLTGCRGLGVCRVQNLVLEGSGFGI